MGYIPPPPARFKESTPKKLLYPLGVRLLWVASGVSVTKHDRKLSWLRSLLRLPLPNRTWRINMKFKWNLRILPKEVRLVRNLLTSRPGSVEELEQHLLTRSRPFSGTGHSFYSQGGWIRVYKDYYGPEVYIGFSGKGMLDCYPTDYNLTREQADRLYKAILSNIPGTTNYRFPVGIPTV